MFFKNLLHKAEVGGKKRYNFTSFAELLRLTLEWLEREEWDFDLIVGIPRSGLLVANIMALRLEKPLTTIDSLEQGHVWLSKLIQKPLVYKKILLVDDSLSTGESMRSALERLRLVVPEATITTAVLITSEEGKGSVDRYAVVVPPRRIFEWNMLHAKKGKVGFDLDGVLAAEIPHGLESDESAYLEWIQNVRPYLVPTYEIDVIITNRLEKYRSPTEAWLKLHNLKYKELVMCGAGSKDERKVMEIPHKVAALREHTPEIYFESDPEESKIIARETGIPVLCMATKTIIE